MPLTPSTRLGPYEILAALGAGGMGEVYRARDGRLGREVAIKVLPQHLSANPEIRSRFEREARTVSSLNHPNICTLYDVGREGETDYLVMELVEGETLAQRLQRGALPPAELLRYGIQIADALDRAHRAGVIHRDLKPGNIMVTRSGAKLMDFGLARATGLVPAGGSGVAAALTQSPTIAQALTAEGTLVGTFQYMSPEQLEGREADARSDIWALGCVLYEMATGRRAFEGRSQASLIAAILERDPPPIGSGAVAGIGTTGDGAPEGLDWIIRHCLNKDPDERIRTAHDVKLQLQRIAEAAGVATSGVRSPATPFPAPASARVARPWRARGPWIVVAGVLVAAAAFAAWAVPRLTARPPVFRFKAETTVPGNREAIWPRVSPDGRMLLFQAVDTTGVERAWVMRLDETTPRPIAGTERLQRAYWSPDSREIVFVAGGKIQRLALGGGTASIVAPAPSGADLSWGARGQILLDGRSIDSIQAVPASGGELKPATRIVRADHEVGTAWPSFLPDGRHFLFLGLREDGAWNIRLGTLGSLDSKVIGRSDGRAEYAPGGWVLFVRGTSLLAQRLSLSAGRLTGEPITIIDDLRIGAPDGHFSISPAGVLALQRGSDRGGSTIGIVDRAGHPVTSTTVVGEVGNPHLSPDGRRILYERHPTGGGAPWGDVSVFDIGRGTDTPLTFSGGSEVRSVWSPDGRRFAWDRTSRESHLKIILQSADGSGGLDSVDTGEVGMYVTQWATPGMLVGYSPKGTAMIARLDSSARSVRPLVDPGEIFTTPQVSPDGRWIAGVNLSASTLNVFVRSISGAAGRWQISSGAGGARPFWTRGGAEIVYETPDAHVMAVDVDTRAGFQAGVPHLLFALPIASFGREVASWAPDASGQRFVVVRPSSGIAAAERSIEVVTNFRSLVERR